MRRERLLTWYRVLPIAILVLLGVVALLALRGPDWYQRMYYPLRYVDEIRAAASRHRVNPYLIAAVIESESGFRPDVTSQAGATGLMQVMPDTARELRRRKLVATDLVEGKPLSDPAANIEYGAAYLRYLVNRYHQIEAVLAAYNAGLHNVDVWAAKGPDIRKQIAFSETGAYVTKVLRARDRYAALYPHTFDGWDQTR